MNRLQAYAFTTAVLFSLYVLLTYATGYRNETLTFVLLLGTVAVYISYLWQKRKRK